LICQKAITSTGKPLARTSKVYRIENGERRSLKRRNGEARELTTSEFNLLEAFVKRPHRVLSRDASWTY
jgi:DNA-binding response OmpR family regulator